MGEMTCTMCTQTMEKSPVQRPVPCALCNNRGQAIDSCERDIVVGEQ